MYYGLDTLIKLGGLAHVDVPLDKITPRTKNAIIRSLKRGIIDSTGGQAATYLAILADKFEIPMMAFSKKGSYWDSLHMKRLPESVIPALSDWWKADRVAYRLENPEKWNEYAQQAKAHTYHWYVEIIEEPDWLNKINADRTSVRILGTKDLSYFEPITNMFTQTDDYQTKIETVIQLIENGETIHVTSNQLN